MSRLFQPSAVAALARRTAQSYAESPSTYVALLVYLLLTGWLYASPLFLLGQASLKGLVEQAALMSVFLIPALTMGLLAEDLKTGTFETLATMPLEDWDIVLGKYLGFAAVQACCVAGLALYAAGLAALVQPPAGLDWGETAGVLAAVGLQGLALGAVGLFASSLGRSQVAAAVTAFLIGFLFLVSGKIGAFLPGWAAAVADAVGFDARLENLAKGVFDTRDLLYFLSVTAAFLYFTVARLEARRS